MSATSICCCSSLTWPGLDGWMLVPSLFRSVPSLFSPSILSLRFFLPCLSHSLLCLPLPTHQLLQRHTFKDIVNDKTKNKFWEAAHSYSLCLCAFVSLSSSLERERERERKRERKKKRKRDESHSEKGSV